MVTQSCLYECRVLHERLWPKQYRFEHGLFMAYLDLDELPELSKKLKLFGFNLSRYFSFQESDHWPEQAGSLKERVQSFLKDNNVHTELSKVKVLTNLRHAGYVFNPATFFFCFSPEDSVPFAAILEVQNTFNEVKPFLIHDYDIDQKTFVANFPKYFYISPFSSLTVRFNIQIREPLSDLNLTIIDHPPTRDYSPLALEHQAPLGAPLLLASLVGRRQPLTDWGLFCLSLKYPLLSWRVIILIHWHAFVLFLKGLYPHPKEDHVSYQRGILNPIFVDVPS